MSLPSDPIPPTKVSPPPEDTPPTRPTTPGEELDLAAPTRAADGELTGRPHLPGYEIERELGRGGMGVVYLARQTQLNRVVAVKMIRAGAHAEPEDVLRFLGEAEAVARLRHPNIVQLYEAGRHDGLPYFTLE